jgi:hypothetical protein
MKTRAVVWSVFFGVAAWLALTGCKSTYYAVWEKLGKEKRDLLRDNVQKARDEQEVAKTEFKDALTRLRELTGFEGGKLETAYRQVEKDYNRCKDRAESIRDRVNKIEGIADDLFAEWEKELGAYSSESLRSASRARLTETKQRFAELRTALRRSTASMEPVLAKLKDQTLFLKHNLNAEAIGSLKGEVVSIDADVQRLLVEMNASIAQAEQFMKGLQ